MGGSFDSWGALEAALQAELESAMNETESLCYLDAVKNTSDYRQVQPKVYEVTGQLENSGRSTGVVGGGNSYSFDIYDDMMFDYDTGTWSTPKVLSNTVVNSDFLKGTIDTGTQALEIFDKVTNSLGVINTAAIGLGIFQGKNNSGESTWDSPHAFFKTTYAA